MTDRKELSDVSNERLRAWADAGVISNQQYVEEMQRRKAACKALEGKE